MAEGEGGVSARQWRAHHLKLAEALLEAVTKHADFLSTEVTVVENGEPVIVVHRDSEGGGPRVEFLGEPS